MTGWLMTLCSCVAVVAQADDPAVRGLEGGITEFTAAYRAWDGERFAAAAATFRQAATNATASSTNFYWLGVAEFHRMLYLQSQPTAASDKRVAAAAMDHAVDAFDEALRRNPRDGESHALLGTLWGMKIGGNLVRAARFGPRVARHRKLALELGPANPRVAYLLGTGQFHTANRPAKQREALATLLEAEKLFEAEARTPRGPLEPRWGHATCLTFIGRTYERLGERELAVAYYRKALAAHPADHVAQEGLARLGEADRP